MKLRKGLNVVIGHKTWSGEIPDKKFAEMTKEWPADKLEAFIKNFGEQTVSTVSKSKKDK
jgi:hypothetical protein